MGPSSVIILSTAKQSLETEGNSMFSSVRTVVQRALEQGCIFEVHFFVNCSLAMTLCSCVGLFVCCICRCYAVLCVHIEVVISVLAKEGMLVIEGV